MSETETKEIEQKDSIISRFSWAFANRYRVTIVLWLIIVIMGALSYTTLLPREGFPPVAVPIGTITGSYFAEDPNTVDKEVVQPMLATIETFNTVERYETFSTANTFGVFIFFEESTNVEDAMLEIESSINSEIELPNGTNFESNALDPSLFDFKYNLILAVYEDENSSIAELQQSAQSVAERLEIEPEINRATVLEVEEEVLNPETGITETRQTSINKISIRENGEMVTYPAVSVGVEKTNSTDAIDLSNAVNSILQDIENDQGINTEVTADFAISIDMQIGSLQESLIGGLIAVVIAALLLISWRAALVIALFIPTVLAGTFFGLNLLGYTINTITLFAIILTLGLFVDDATIIVEAIDAHKDDKGKHKKIIKAAVSRVGLASIAGTLTTILVFTPMLAISGILGSFIKLLPITVILALSISLIVSLIIIPFISRPLVLTLGKKKTFLDKLSILGPVEKFIGDKLSYCVRIHKTNKAKGRTFTAIFVGISVAAVLAAGMIAQTVNFDIFPQSKDSDFLNASVNFEPGTTLQQAQTFTDDLDAVIIETVGSELKYITYFSANERTAEIQIGLTPFDSRSQTSHDFIKELTEQSSSLNGASIKFSQLDAGPPAEDFPFQARIFSSDVDVLENASDQIVDFIDGAEVSQGTQKTNVAEVRVEGLDIISRSEDGRFVTVEARFENTSLNSGAVIALKDKVEAEFDEGRLSDLGLGSESLSFDAGQESENEESFNSLGTGLIVALLLMYLLLILLFNSFIQPLLIFIAIPFSLLGVFGGLKLTDNSLSFFVMLGLLGLIGIVVNNSILLTEYANQERRKGKDRRDAIANALQDRMRPLITTTLTTILALLPLALTDPFWQPLAYTIIFGMASSTTLIILAFPYYYLAFEWLRDLKNKKIPALK